MLVLRVLKTLLGIVEECTGEIGLAMKIGSEKTGESFFKEYYLLTDGRARVLEYRKKNGELKISGGKVLSVWESEKVFNRLISNDCEILSLWLTEKISEALELITIRGNCPEVELLLREFLNDINIGEENCKEKLKATLQRYLARLAFLGNELIRVKRNTPEQQSSKRKFLGFLSKYLTSLLHISPKLFYKEAP